MRTGILRSALATAMALVLSIGWVQQDASAQDYGVGETVVVPELLTDTLALDGVYEADIWDTGTLLDLLTNTNWWNEEFPDVDVTEAWARVLYSDDTLYVYASVAENELFFHEEGWGGDNLLVGIDPIHEAGVTDTLVDIGEEGYSGWPENAPAEGPYAYTIFDDDEDGTIALQWGFAGIDPEAEGWARGTTWTDEATTSWGFEAAFYVPDLAPGAEIGFNIGGATGSEGTSGEPYGYFSRWSVEEAGSDVLGRTASYATLRMAGGDSEGYGSGVTLQVPRVDAGSITIDGVDDEAAWAEAQSDIDVTAHWSSYGPVGEATPEPDLAGETKLLWSDDTLYIHHRLLDPVLFFQEEDPWGSDMILIGIDNSLEGDSAFGPNFDGGIHNAPEGVYTYFVNPLLGFTFAWNDSIAQRDPGLVNAEVFMDEDTGEWGLEAAIHVPAIELGAKIGFDIGGAQASPDQCGEGYCDYAYFAWQSGSEGTDPGAINRDATYWATLDLVEEITSAIDRVDEVPTQVSLHQNYPNPFNPTTTIEFDLTQAGMIQLDVFNLLGQKVETLVNEQQAAGVYRFTWDAADLSSGMYIYQLRVDGQLVGSRKMMLIK